VAKEKKESWLLSQDKISRVLFYLLIIFLPSQFGKHFWPESSFVYGLRLDYLSPIIYFTDILILLILVLSLNNIISFIKSINNKNKALILISTIVLVTGVVLSKTPLAGFYGLLKLTEYIFLSIYIIQNFQKLSKRNLFIAFSIPIIYESLLSFFQFLNKGSIGGFMYFLGERTFSPSTPGIANASINGELILRPYATFSHPNVLAGFVIIYLLFLFYFVVKKEKHILYFLTLLATTTLLLTFSRIAILYWGVSLALLFGISIYKKYKKQKSNTVKTVLITIIFFISFFLLIKDTPLVQRFIETRIYEQSIVQRQELIADSFQMFLKSPIVGVGINNFYFNLTNTAFIQPVHNIFLFILAQCGALILIVFLYILAKALTTMIKIKNIYLTLALFSIVFLGSFDHYFLTLQQGQIITTLIFGIIFSHKTKIGISDIN
jgi:O-antigen ligase